ncbi:unnamed protein product [Amoebophrya sp. A120]|nr:unnamed protein product [Amoebophrya sp. A120]CAD7975562.1 unnamed protein product [Amoebophrya sp. A120]|eukprot:GSA120T00023971001.1
MASSSGSKGWRDASSSTTALAVTALVSTVVGTYLAVEHYRRKNSTSSSSSQALSKDRTKEILQKLAAAFHEKCREFSEMSFSVRENLEAKNMSFPEEQLKQQLVQQSGAMEKLEAIQMAVLQESGVAPEEIQAAQERYQKDADISELSASFDTMLADALSGLVPLLPLIKKPQIADSEIIIDVLQEINEGEVLELCRHFRETGVTHHSVQHLGEVITKARADVEKEAVARMYYGKSVAEFWTAVGYFDRMSFKFLSERRKLTRAHRLRLSKLFVPVEAQGGKGKDGSVPGVQLAPDAPPPPPTAEREKAAAPLLTTTSPSPQKKVFESRKEFEEGRAAEERKLQLEERRAAEERMKLLEERQAAEENRRDE